MSDTHTSAQQPGESLYQIQRKASCIASLALAADIVLSASSLPTKLERENVALDIMIALRYLGEWISSDADQLDR